MNEDNEDYVMVNFLAGYCTTKSRKETIEKRLEKTENNKINQTHFYRNY